MLRESTLPHNAGAQSDFLDMTQVLDLESHFKDALATLPDPDKELVEEAFHRLDDANANPTAVSSAKWAFIRAVSGRSAWHASVHGWLTQQGCLRRSCAWRAQWPHWCRQTY